MMMDRNREAGRRGSMAAVNGSLSRRRQRTASSTLRDSPDDDGGMDLLEPGRLRDRGAKKDKDRDRSSRSKRRRGDRLLHGTSNREEGEESSEDSVDDDDDDDDDDNSNHHHHHHHHHSSSHHHSSPPSTSAASSQQRQQIGVLGPASSSNPTVQYSTTTTVLPQAGNSASHHQQQYRKSLPAKVVRAPPVWKVADEMIGVSIPRKARSASAKRSHECWISGSGAAAAAGGGGGSGGGGGGVGAGGAGGGEPMVHRQASTSPARPSPPAPPASTTPISPSSSTASVRKKMKPLSGGNGGNKLRPPKNTKPPSSVQDIEFEVAEVLFGMTRQFPSKQETSKADDNNNGTSNDAKSRVSSPNSTSTPAAAVIHSSSSALVPPPSSNSSSGPAVVAPKRKRPRPVKLEDESASSQSTSLPPPAPAALASSPGKTDVEKPAPALELPSSSKPDKDIPVSSSVAVANGPLQAIPDPQEATPVEIQQEPSVKLELDAATAPDSQPSVLHLVVDRPEPSETKDEDVSVSRQSSKVELDMNCDEASTTKDGRCESPNGGKFKIDLMAPPPGKSSPEADGETDFVMSTEFKMGVEAETTTRVPPVASEEKPVRKEAKLEIGGDSIGTGKTTEKSPLLQELDSKKRPAADPALIGVDNKLDKPGHSTGNKQLLPKHQHQPKVPKTESKPDTKGQQAGSIPLPVALAGWPGSLPTFGYMGQMPSLPAAFTMDVNAAGSAKAPQFPSPQLRLKRCATHCYIAQNICYHQQIMKMQQFWPAAPGADMKMQQFWPGAPGAAPVYGAKPYNLNVMPAPSESLMGGNPLQQGQGGGVGVRNMGPSTDNNNNKQATVGSYGGNPSSKDVNPVANAFVDTFQPKQPASQSSSSQAAAAAAATSNMLHGPALFFPLGQQQQPPSSTVIWSGASMKAGGGGGSGAGNAAPTTNSAATATVSSAAGAAPAAATVSFNYGNLPPPGEAQYLAILQNNGYPYPIPAHIGAPPPQYRGNHAAAPHPMPFFNGSFYASPMFPASQIPHPQQQQPHAAAATIQQGHQNAASTSTGSTSSQKHGQQNRVLPGGGAASTTIPDAAASHMVLPNMKSAQSQRPKLDGETGAEDVALNARGASAAATPSSQGQKAAVIGPNFTAIPVHPQDHLALISAAAAAMGGAAAGAGGEKNNSGVPQQNVKMELPHPSQGFAMTFPAPYAAAGVDFASLAQNHSLFQNLPEAARQGYHQYAAAAAAAAAQAAAAAASSQHKKPRSCVGTDDGKASGAGDANGDEEKKGITTASGKHHHPSSGFPTRPLGVPVGDNDPPPAAILSNSVMDSGCNLNIPASSIRVVSNRPPPTSTTSSVASGTTNVLSPQQQQQHNVLSPQQQQQQQQHNVLSPQQQQQQIAVAQFHQLRQQQQVPQQIQIQHQLNSRPKSAAPAAHSGGSSSVGGGFAEHLHSGSAMGKFPSGAGFPQGIVQSNGPNQSGQWKNMGRPSSAVPSPSSASSGKSHQQQQSSRAAASSQAQQQAAMSSMNHQTQISFGSNSLKLPSASGQQIVVGGGSSNNPHSAATGSMAVGGSPQTTALLNNSKNAAAGSPRSSSSSMKGGGGPLSCKVSQQMQHQAVAPKSSPPSSGPSKSSPVNNRNAPSILGQPNNATPLSNSQATTNNKAQQQQLLQKHQFPAPSQLFFSAPYMQQGGVVPSTHQANMSAAAAYYQSQRRPSDPTQQSSQCKPSSSTGMLSLSSHPAISLASATVTTDPGKATAVSAAANNGKTATAAAAAQYAVTAQSAAVASQHPLMFPYIHIPTLPVKQAAAGDPNPASGNDSLHSCWQAEKR